MSANTHLPCDITSWCHVDINCNSTRFTVHKLSISENRPVDHIGVLQIPKIRSPTDIRFSKWACDGFFVIVQHIPVLLRVNQGWSQDLVEAGPILVDEWSSLWVWGPPLLTYPESFCIHTIHRKWNLWSYLWKSIDWLPIVDLLGNQTIGKDTWCNILGTLHSRVTSLGQSSTTSSVQLPSRGYSSQFCHSRLPTNCPEDFFCNRTCCMVWYSMVTSAVTRK